MSLTPSLHKIVDFKTWRAPTFLAVHLAFLPGCPDTNNRTIEKYNTLLAGLEISKKKPDAHVHPGKIS